MTEPFLGQIMMTSFTFPPKGWAECNGALLPINQNQALFSLLGTTYGGNGQTNFALPDLRGRVPIHTGAGYNMGQAYGAESVTIAQSQMPAHVHAVQVRKEDGGSNVPSGTVLAQSPSQLYDTPSQPAAMHQESLTNAGGGQPHSNMQPYTVLTFSIALQGIFPSRN